MCELIEILNHNAFGAANRREALELMRSETPDAAFIDLRLAGDSGLDIARDRRREESENSLPRIVLYGLTGDATDEAVNACLAVGMDDCLFKPVYLEVLESQLNKLAETR